jgi:predicted alpha/beta hydrolase family esterase
MVKLVFIPGLNNSGPGHWQSWWQRQLPSAGRVEQDDWRQPDLTRWSDRVTATLDKLPEPVWIVAHSFGCLAAIHAGLQQPERIQGALLVAPADPARFGIADELLAYEPAFATLLVASENDDWMSLARAQVWAERWGSRFVNQGRAGHINDASGYGVWPEGPLWLECLQTLTRPGGSVDRCPEGMEFPKHPAIP